MVARFCLLNASMAEPFLRLMLVGDSRQGQGVDQ